MSPLRVSRIMFRESQEAVGGNSVCDKYEAKALHDPESSDAVYCNRPLSRKTDNKRIVSVKSSKTFGRMKNSLSIKQRDIKTENGPKRLENSAPPYGRQMAHSS